MSALSTTAFRAPEEPDCSGLETQDRFPQLWGAALRPTLRAFPQETAPLSLLLQQETFAKLNEDAP